MKRYRANYLVKTKRIISQTQLQNEVVLQFFQRADQVMLCGIIEVLALLAKHTPVSSYQVRYLAEGSIINQGDIVLELRGAYQHFGEWEGVIDGILARQSSIATNAMRVAKAAKNKTVVFMGDRADHYRNQVGDGYAVALGGIKTQVTKAQVKLHDGVDVGTMPHALIALNNGDIVAALKAYAKTYPRLPLTALVDFNNDVIADSLKALAAFSKRLVAIRVDTSAAVSDKMFDQDTLRPAGVNVTQIKRLRVALDQANGKHVKIIVSSGFDETKINEFETNHAPVDTYGVGASILKVWVNFTADIVEVNRKRIAKVGRGYRAMKNALEL